MNRRKYSNIKRVSYDLGEKGKDRMVKVFEEMRDPGCLSRGQPLR